MWSLKAWGWLHPIIPTFHPAPDGPSAGNWTPGGYHTFEHRWALAEAFELQSAIGRSRVAQRIHALARRLKEGLAGLPGVRLVTPMAENVSAGLVCFDVTDLSAPEGVKRLRDEHRIVASVTPYAVEHVRLGCGLQVDEADVDAAIAAVRAVRG